MILSNTSFTGGKNLFLGYAYIVVGCICFLLGLMFLIIHIKYKPRYVKSFEYFYYLKNVHLDCILDGVN